MTPPRKAALSVETRSIDHIPHGERRGKAWHQAPFWFTGNFVLVTMVIGEIGPAAGLSVSFSILSVVLGSCFGTCFMAFHANQGPRMGLPQMIQSRPQFGMRGAIVPFAATVLIYVGFNVFDMVIAVDALHAVLPGPNWLWYTALAVVASVIAVVGHDLLHLVQRWLTPLLAGMFAVLTVAAFLTHTGPDVMSKGGWSLAAFLAQFAAAAGYQLSYAVYVSDYSRYLPERTSSRAVIGWTYLGAAGSACWLMSLGALIGAALPGVEPTAAIRQIGAGVVPGFGTAVVLCSVPALVTIMAVNGYGAMLTTASGVDAFRRVAPTARVRVAGIVAAMTTALVLALAMPADYLDSFNDFVVVMLYFLVPWTAINLVDFYLIRRGHYEIAEIFNPDGVYGRWNWRGLSAYAIGFGAMTPFFATSFYTGPAARALGGVDVSFLVGLLVGGGVYGMLCPRSAQSG